MKRSKHNLTHTRLTTGFIGQLLPVGLLEVLPGDSFRHSSRALVRAATLTAPLMHEVEVRVHHWFVPARILWPEFEEFIVGKNQETIPTITYNSSEDDYGLMDQFGLPDHNGLEFNALPIRAYNAIWNRFYRDQDIHTEREPDDLTLARVSWAKDYFTTAREYPQFGEASVSIPFAAGTRAPVFGDGSPIKVQSNSAVYGLGSNSGQVFSPFDGVADDEDLDSAPAGNPPSNKTIGLVTEDNGPSGLYADMAGAEGGGVDINDFRFAFASARFLEQLNRYGSRYVDYLRMLGVRPRDGRLQDPEYLGGGKNKIAFSEVLATAEGSTTDVGDMAGHGITAIRTRPYRRFFEEHGYVVSLMFARPKSIYVDQMHRLWRRRTKDEIWHKHFEALGPQPVYTQELYGKAASADTVFGYQERFKEYREHPSYVTGLFRGNELKNWHLGRIFSDAPSLNESFLNCTPRTDPFAATSLPQLMVMLQNQVVARRLVAQEGK